MAAKGPGDPILLTVAEAAELLQISRDLAYELVARGELPHIRLGMAGRVIRVPRFGLEQWIAREAGVPASAVETVHQPVIQRH
jgi:excisionase family DNA binding protein